MFKYTKIEFELLIDYEKYLLFEKGIIIRILLCIENHLFDNNKYIPETFDSDKPIRFLTYLDANNLYGWAMSKCMLYQILHGEILIKILIIVDDSAWLEL